MSRRLSRRAERTGRPLRRTGAPALGLALALAAGCGMYGDLTLEERPVRTPEITEVEPISALPGDSPEVPAPPADPPPSGDGTGDGDEEPDKDEPAGGS